MTQDEEIAALLSEVERLREAGFQFVAAIRGLVSRHSCIMPDHCDVCSAARAVLEPQP
jgi:hypothetical protein